MDIRESEFEQTVLQAERPVLVDFWASWCPPCKMMLPVVEKLSHQVAEWADIFSVNIDRCPQLASQYQISGVPTFVSFAAGQAIDRRTGALTEGQLIHLLNAARDAMPLCPAADEFELELEAEPAASFITIVSGLPRSGTSMMMRMLEAGGIPALTDDQRTPDEDNPNGYYEFEDVKGIQNDAAWMDRAAGHSVKMVYRLLQHLPADRNYRIVFMRRNVDEILQSQKLMLQRNGIDTDIPDTTMKLMFERELRNFYTWLPTQSHLNLINISYNDLISDPLPVIHQINRHLNETLNTQAMLQTIDPALYRHRAA